jgi:RNA polymerase sigma factor (sigma-70 family)
LSDSADDGSLLEAVAMDDDNKLLSAYVIGKSERAFAELVRRHLGLVYSVALRRVGHDAHLAEDVVQVVFSALARKAKSLMDRPTLSGWLYVSAHAASAEAVRKECRRRRREEESILMQEPDGAGKSTPEWGQIRPLLDTLIVSLGRMDREAIVLRFFEKQSFAEIGASLHLTEDTARKRVERALTKLRSNLTKAGFASSAAALSEALAGESAIIPPAGLAARVASTAISDFATAAVGTSLVMSILNAIPPGIVTFVGIGLGLGGMLAWQYRGIKELRSELAVKEGQESEVRSLRSDNERLARVIAQARNASPSRRTATVKILSAAHSIASPAAPAVPVSVVWLTPEGQIRWNGHPVTLAEFLEHLTSYRASDPEPDGKILISGMTQGAPPFSAFAYAVEQASKAGIKNITLSMPPSPTPSDINWLSPRAPLAGPLQPLPPTLPDPIPNN